MNKADQIIDGCKSLAKHYADDDPLRYPFIVGVMEMKIRELAFIIENHETLIKEQEAHIAKLEHQLSH